MAVRSSSASVCMLLVACGRVAPLADDATSTQTETESGQPASDVDTERFDCLHALKGEPCPDASLLSCP